jgi:polysaccharide export outer membrane protein
LVAADTTEVRHKPGMNKVVNHVSEAGKGEAEMKAVIDAFEKVMWDSQDATQIFGITCKAQVHEIGLLSRVFRGRWAGIRKWLGPLIVLLALLLPSVAPAQQSSSKTQTSSKELMALNGNSNTEVQNRVTGDPSYVIGPTDVLDISVWKEPEISRVVPVRPDGRISLPLLSDLQAAGLTPTQLAAHITDSLKKFMTGPQVTVIVATINSQRIYILGEVTRAGAFPLLPGMTVLQALSSAGGFTQYANIKNIYLLRQENGQQVKYAFNYKDVTNGKKSEQNVVLKAGDTIIVP